MRVSQCDAEIQRRRITETGTNVCKETNTFILASTSYVKNICEKAGEPYRGAILSSATIGNITLLLLCAVLAMTVIAAAFFIYAVKNKCECCMAAASFQERSEQRRFKISKDTQIYSAAVFTLMKQDTGGVRGPKAVNRERIYAAFKAFGLKS
ncbi:hypothetical protein Q8A73_011062 [Channa argus]|nr:hypothetical protein Q8A73_011062 [Channa argus]